MGVINIKKIIISFGAALLGLFAFVGSAHAATTLQSLIQYYTYYNPGFVRSFTPVGSGEMTQVDNSDGSVTVNIIGTLPYEESGFVIYKGTLGDLNNFTLTGTGSEYGLNLWFDINKNGEFFSWTGDTYNNVDGDTYALGPSSVSGVMNITDSSQFFLMANGHTYTVGELKTGNFTGIDSSTPIAIWVGVSGTGSKSATINLPSPLIGKSILKATGSIEAIGNGYHLFAEFDSHTATDKQPAKGSYHVWGFAGVPIDWYGDIKNVSIVNNHAILHGVFVSGIADGNSYVGKPFTLEMTDNGSPAFGNDFFSSGWGSNAVFPWNLVGGNLVVHK